MLLSPEREASTNTLIPCDANEVKNVLHPECELALAMPAALYIQKKCCVNVLALNPQRGPRAVKRMAVSACATCVMRCKWQVLPVSVC